MDFSNPLMTQNQLLFVDQHYEMSPDGWSSTYLMLKQYVDIHQILYSNEELNSLSFNLLNGIELELLKLYLSVLEQLNDITKANLYNKTR